MTDSFELYKTILITISDHHPNDAQMLFNLLSDTEYVREQLKAKNSTLPQDTLDTLDNLIDDGLIRGKRTATKDGIWYQLSGLTTLGQSYLLQASRKPFSNKLKDYLKENGIPMSPQNITKCIAKLTL